jgi:hypothetical protein
MNRSTVDIIEGVIVVVIAVSILAFPRVFTKKDLTAEENRGTAKTLKKCGWVSLAAGIVFLLAGIVKSLSNR